jgi:hypothetical protein
VYDCFGTGGCYFSERSCFCSNNFILGYFGGSIGFAKHTICFSSDYASFHQFGRGLVH